MLRITDRNFLFSRISVRVLMTKKMTRELMMTPRDINSLLLNEAGSLPATFPGVFATVAVGASSALFTTGFVVVFASSSPVPSLIMTVVALYYSGTNSFTSAFITALQFLQR